MRKSYIILVMVVAAAWSNIRMLEQVAGYDLFHLLDFPREFRFLELALIVFAFLYAYTSHRRLHGKTQFEHLEWPGVVVGIGLLGGILNGVGIMDIMQGLYLFVSPLLVYYTCRWLKFSWTELRILGRAIAIILLVNIPAWFYQIITFLPVRKTGDDVNGVLRDAHLFATFFYCAALYGLARSVLTRSLGWALVTFAMFSVGFLAFNEKATLFMIPLGVGLVIAAMGSLRSKRVLTSAIVIIIVVSLLVFSSDMMDQVEVGLRTSVITESSIVELGTVIAYLQLPSVFIDVPHAVLIGVGPGNYGSAIAIRRHVEGTASQLSKTYVGDFDLAGYVGAFAWRTNYLIGMLVEYGIVFTLLLVLFYYRMVREIARRFRAIKTEQFRAGALYALGSISLLWLTALVSNISNLDEGILVYPVMMTFACLYTISDESRSQQERGAGN